MDEIVFCPKCAWIGHSFEKNKNLGNYMICCECHANLVGTGIPIYEEPRLLSHEWFELRRKIFKEMIEPLNQLDESLPIYRHHYNDLFGSHEEDLKDPNKTLKFRPGINQTNIPHCPVCGSKNISKISSGNKVGSAMLFGVFAIGHISKTFKCNKCGYKF